VKEKYVIKNLMSILILMLSLSHCSSTDFIAIGGAVFTGMEDKPNPVSAIRMLTKENKNDE
jgi:hypothetical protein